MRLLALALAVLAWLFLIVAVFCAIVGVTTLGSHGDGSMFFLTWGWRCVRAAVGFGLVAGGVAGAELVSGRRSGRGVEPRQLVALGVAFAPVVVGGGVMTYGAVVAAGLESSEQAQTALVARWDRGLTASERSAAVAIDPQALSDAWEADRRASLDRYGGKVVALTAAWEGPKPGDPVAATCLYPIGHGDVLCCLSKDAVAALPRDAQGLPDAPPGTVTLVGRVEDLRDGPRGLDRALFVGGCAPR